MIGHDPEQTYTAAIIGSGSAGLTLAIGLARFGRETVLIEGDRVGGDCTNVGCIPSKALLHAARTAGPDPLHHVRARRDELNIREDRELRDDEQIHLVRGWARLTPRREPHVAGKRRAVREPHVVLVDGPHGEQIVRAEHVVLATGSRPIDIPVDGLSPDRMLTNETLFELVEIPRRLVIVGGGAIAVEMATAFTDLGSTVHVVELQDRLLPTEDPLASRIVTTALGERGVVVHTGTSVVGACEPSSASAPATSAAGEPGASERTAGATLRLADGTVVGDVDRVLVAVGRRPALDRLGLDAAGVEHTTRGVVADSWGRTTTPGIWAVGDVTGNTLTTHGANAIGRRAVRAIALPRLPRIGRPRALPSAVYADPELASVGLTPGEVRALPERGRRRYVVELADLDRGYTDEIRNGAVAVDVERFSGRILRATIVGPAAAEMIGIFTLAIDRGIGIRKLFGMVHPYPSYAEAIGRIADEFAGDTYPRLAAEWWAATQARVAARLRR